MAKKPYRKLVDDRKLLIKDGFAIWSSLDPETQTSARVKP